MSYKIHMDGYAEPRTVFQIEALHAWKHKQYFAPVIVEVSPVGYCNQKCKFCYSDKIETKGDKIPDAILTRLFCDLAGMGVQAVSLQGTGEPLMHGGLPDAIVAGAGKGLRYSLTTTGVVFTEKIQSRILQHLTFMKCSVLENDRDRYALMHGCSPKQWDQLIANLGAAANRRSREGLDVALMGTVYVELNNFDRLPQIIRFYRDLGLDYIVVQEATYTEFTPSNQSRNTSEHFTAAEIDAMKAEVLKLNTEDFTVKVRFPVDDTSYHVGMYKDCWKDDHCQGIKFFPLVAADGNVYSCYRAWGKSEFSMGSLHTQSFEEIWRGERRQEVERQIMGTPPGGDECAVCGISKLNDILSKYEQPNKWRSFLI
ncbi:MAG TPA: SPASM domain-containing protein [Zoogloea sp.]|uniref:SPASM domain-containing protein n=1 Tax=Zoogloea sp. TaxID=49181 RepID=UPI002CECD9EB|nr:SPASM domain-containing protein [Zoogloea sp.]HMV17992.1 SPASM domain-containing protein [Rhodocyclaceae bacterium]HMV62246.1 SPASM domain-containing protein [Rhodocyclaceae bacterium]HMY48258.1 SPASM domain-containing protein [Rhodocyclaceae bacterium]HMZ74946.1 SPASM domain-containing protein [Rhodocyclaceae bacterium]HNA66471.1 SPASM domain-containing protein [Rhodocyclaceae bacterium]